MAQFLQDTSPQAEYVPTIANIVVIIFSKLLHLLSSLQTEDIRVKLKAATTWLVLCLKDVRIHEVCLHYT